MAKRVATAPEILHENGGELEWERCPDSLTVAGGRVL
jgi:hypothetical protein